MLNFRALGAPPPDLQNSPPPLRIPGYPPDFIKYGTRKLCFTNSTACSFDSKLQIRLKQFAKKKFTRSTKFAAFVCSTKTGAVVVLRTIRTV